MNKETDFDEIVIYYDDFTRVKKLKVTLYDALGRKIRKISKKEIRDYSAVSGGTLYSDSRVKYVDASYGIYPYTVEYEYELEHRETREYPDWYIVPETNTRVKYTTYTLIMPSDLKARYKAENTSVEPTITQKGNSVTYHWLAKHLEPIAYEPFINYRQVMPRVRIAPSQFSVDGYRGDMSSWESFGQFMYDLNKERDELPDELRQKVQELIANASSDAEKVAILYDSLQENTRYVSVQLGIGGWQTFDAKYVYKNQYGDCKAPSNYMKAMLKEAGITSYTTLIRAGAAKRSFVDEEFSSGGDFNHVILYVPNVEDGVWLECTSSQSPFNYLSSSTENRTGLLITPDGGQLITTPQKDHNHHLSSTKATVQLNEDGTATAQVVMNTYEDEHDVWRYAFYDEDLKDQEERLQDDISLPSYDIKGLKIKVYDEEPRADLSYNLNIKQFGSKLGKRIVISPNLLHQLTIVPKEISDRKSRLYRAIGYTSIDTIIYELPTDYRVTSVPDQFKQESPFGVYKSRVVIEGEKLMYIRELSMFSFDLPATDYEALRAFYSQIIKADRMQLIVKKGGA